MKNSSFYNQAELMLRCLAPLDQHRNFALKGGTALNFFIFNLPRLSVDIDLVYLPEKNHEDGLKAISNELELLGGKIKSLIPNSKIQKMIQKNSKLIHKINVIRGDHEVTIEPNLVIRQTLKKPKTLGIVRRAEELFEISQETLVLDTDEILAGKICAALDRQHPRDFFDIHNLFKAKMQSAELRKLFLVYLCGGNRPLHEVLFPTLLDIKDIYEKQFNGMTSIEIALETLYEARNRLIQWIHQSLTSDEKEFLISFVELKPEFSKLGINKAANFPSIRWKQLNLNKLKNQNLKKFELQSLELKKRFEKL